MLRLKRVYEPPMPEDGERILVERLWPRGLRKEEARLSAWLKDLAPSTELRQWFGHEPERWEEFRQRYQSELMAGDKQPLLRDLASKAKKDNVTLVYAARDEQHNGALVLKDVVERM